MRGFLATMILLTALYGLSREANAHPRPPFCLSLRQIQVLDRALDSYRLHVEEHGTADEKRALRAAERVLRSPR